MEYYAKSLMVIGNSTFFNISCTSSCWRSIVTVAVSCIISEIKRDMGLHRNIAIMFGKEKLEWCGYWLPNGE